MAYIKIVKYKEIGILITFFSLWLSVYFAKPSQEIMAFFFIFSLGILHGSNDLKLISKVSASSKSIQLVYFFSSYIATVIVASLLFYFLPIVALIAFVVFSAFHFGEQHWNELLNKNRNSNCFYFLNYGLTVLFLLFYLNDSATNDIIYELSGFTLSSDTYLIFFLVNVIVWIGQSVFFTYKKYFSLQQILFEIFLVLVFAIVFKTATLIWAFAIYFIFWHSIPSIIEQQSFLYGEASIRTLKKYINSSFLIWLISISSILLLYFWLQDSASFLPVFFAFLGAITFAHSLTISSMFRMKNKK